MVEMQREVETDATARQSCQTNLLFCEYSQSKRRSLRWIIQRKQTANNGAKHLVRQAFLPFSF
jgi:hypothetical protein